MRRSKAEQDDQAEQNRKGLKRAEATALLLLLRLRKQAEREALRRQFPEQIATEHLRSVMRGGILAVRRVARESRLIRAADEFSSLGIDVELGHHDVAGLVDHVRASRASASFVENPTDASLFRIAVTENAQAYSDMRFAAEPVEGVRLYRRWDALLDACHACFERDGETVPLGQSFSGDEPGSVHPHCRCTWELVSERELALAA